MENIFFIISLTVISLLLSLISYAEEKRLDITGLRKNVPADLYSRIIY